MTGRTHDLAAFTALGFIALTQPLPQMTLATGLVAVVANMIGGIAPDIDQPTAPFWRNLPVGRIFGKVFRLVIGGHRFLSHSILGVVLFGFGFHSLLEVLRPSFPTLDMGIIWWAFMIGFVSHLVMDTFTREGVPWLLPIPVKFGIPPVKAYRVETGEFVERFIIFPLLIGANGYLYYNYYHVILLLLHHNFK
ncbi:MAG TPA: metal-dependent hydrolase [Patescibacteria group bacterium]|nr:metal-dependent hydrolase [Patescibacteria group bacterium]